jgi:hypothetical protein
MLFNRLDKNGSLIVEELYYDSYIFRELTSFLIFYGLKFFNFTHIDISKFLKEYSMGLEVNFFSNRDLINMLKAHGEPHLIKCKPAKVPSVYKLFFLKKIGNISYVIDK